MKSRLLRFVAISAAVAAACFTTCSARAASRNVHHVGIDLWPGRSIRASGSRPAAAASSRARLIGVRSAHGMILVRAARVGIFWPNVVIPTTPYGIEPTNCSLEVWDVRAHREHGSTNFLRQRTSVLLIGNRSNAALAGAERVRPVLGNRPRTNPVWGRGGVGT